jgi:hypothetical protein
LRNIHSNVIRMASPGRVGCAHARSWGTKNEFIWHKSGLKCFIVPTNHITGFWTNEMAESSVQQPIKIGWLLLCPRPNNIYGDRIVIGILGFWTDHDYVHLREMRQRIYREEQPDQTSKDPCSFLTDLFLWDMQQRVQPSWHHKQTWSGPQLQLDLRSMWSVLQQTGHPSTPSCPARETRGQAETTDEEISSTWIRTRDEAATYRVTTKKRAELRPTWRFYLTTPRPEPWIDNIGSPFGQRKRPATVSKTVTTLPCMRWQRPPLQRWFIGSLENRKPEYKEKTTENHRPVTSYWPALSHNVVSSTPRHERGSNSQL